MNDNDLLQYAANACGYGTLSYGVLNGCPMLKTISGYRVWNPRDDSGTSLELFVKLEIQVIPPDKCSQIAVAIYCDINGDTHQFPQQVINGNKYAATRLAILRAAADIGKSMESKQNDT